MPTGVDARRRQLANHGVRPARVLESTGGAAHGGFHALAVEGLDEVQPLVIIGGELGLSHTHLPCDIAADGLFACCSGRIVWGIAAPAVQSSLTIHRVFQPTQVVQRDPLVAGNSVRETHNGGHFTIVI
jgi:hypothetical protein